MLNRKTEQLSSCGTPVDKVSLREAAQLMAEAQAEAAKVVFACAPELAQAAKAMAKVIRSGGRLIYVAAGSSGLMAAADAMELKGTFGISPAQVRILMAGGVPTTSDMPGDVEDACDTLKADLAEISERDCMIAVTASGSTPFTLAAARIAQQSRTTVVGIANNGNAPLFDLSDHAILLDTPPELLSGSTRMGAGTAQKIALNTLSTLMGVELGHIYQGMMVNLVADNAKLRERAHAIVRRISGVDDESAARALSLAGADVKLACLLAKGAPSVRAASDALAAVNGLMGPAILELGLE